ncbi:unnamed protein product, partial [Tenebrio molitor]
DSFSTTRAIRNWWFEEHGRVIGMRTIYRRPFFLSSSHLSIEETDWNGAERERDPQFDTERHIHHTVGVMIWSAIAYGSRSPVVFI